ncbi:hypothetical protein ELI44_34780 [Rhizobium ruizarguesonis]|nr:hypothetical protein ELI42_33395 [Rhizobium ruizarguesonis]TAU46041.1 hypothetical protein ELI44_34780 [Rhizobium ruizarguesonis]
MIRRRSTKRICGVDRKGAIFVKPKLIAEIEYRAWTDDGKLRTLPKGCERSTMEPPSTKFCSFLQNSVTGARIPPLLSGSNWGRSFPQFFSSPLGYAMPSAL